MRAKRLWTFQSLLSCVLWNGILLTIFFLMARQILYGIGEWVTPFVQQEATSLPEDVRLAFMNIQQMVLESLRYLAPVLFGVGGLITLLLWLFVLLGGRGLAKRVQRELGTAQPAAVSKSERKKAEREAREAPAAMQPVLPSPQPAIQMLSILQREGRLIDFLNEDLSAYDDSQIGAAVRSIHQGCREALLQHVELKPIYEEAEGVEVTVLPNFDSRSIRLTGNVSGDPPFKGTLRHRGWRVTGVQLPQPTAAEQKKEWIVAPAEVEVGG